MRTPRIGRSVRLGIIAGIATFALLVGTGAGWAYWSTKGTAGVTATAANLTITSTGFSPTSTTTFGNESIVAAASTALRTTGSITFTNTTTTTSTQPQTLSVVFTRGSGDTTLAGATTLTVWAVTNATACTNSASPTQATSATWSAGVTVATSLAVGASATWCLRNDIADRQNVDAAGGTLSFVPQAAATLTAGAFTRSVVSTGTAQTQYIYPLQRVEPGWLQIRRDSGNGWCLDVWYNEKTAGGSVVTYPCKATNMADEENQNFRYIDTDNDGYGELVPRSAPNLRLAAPASTTPGGLIKTATADGSAAQKWQPQLIGGGVFQFVNLYSGLCLTAALSPATSTSPANATTQTPCNGSADQRFAYTVRYSVALACTNIGSDRNQSVTYSWDKDMSGPYTIQAYGPKGFNPAWTTIATAPAGATSATVAAPIGDPLTKWGAGLLGIGSASYDVRIVDDASGKVLGTSTVQVYNNFLVLGYYYARC